MPHPDPCRPAGGTLSFLGPRGLTALAAAVVLLALPAHAHADEGQDAQRQIGTPTPAQGGPVQSPGTVGLSFGMPFPGLSELLALAGGPRPLTTVGGAYFLDTDAALRVDLGLGLALEPITDFSLHLGVAYRNYHLGMRGRVAPFMEPGGSFGWISETLFLSGFFNYGAEYFFNEQLSIGGSIGAQLNLVDGTDVIEIVTARGGLELSIYW